MPPALPRWLPCLKNSSDGELGSSVRAPVRGGGPAKPPQHIQPGFYEGWGAALSAWALCACVCAPPIRTHQWHEKQCQGRQPALCAWLCGACAQPLWGGAARGERARGRSKCVKGSWSVTRSFQKRLLLPLSLAMTTFSENCWRHVAASPHPLSPLTAVGLGWWHVWVWACCMPG